MLVLPLSEVEDDEWDDALEREDKGDAVRLNADVVDAAVA